MANDSTASPGPTPPRKYVWPWFVALGIVLGILLAVLWISKEVERTKKLREMNSAPIPISNPQGR